MVQIDYELSHTELKSEERLFEIIIDAIKGLHMGKCDMAS